MVKLKHIMIGGKTYPIIMDLNVLEYIQTEYGSIKQFEMDILGYRYKKDKDGRQVYDSDGKPEIEITEPSVAAIKAALPSMINEGLSIEADRENRAWNAVSDNEIFRECTIPFGILADMIHEEFARCFRTKK